MASRLGKENKTDTLKEKESKKEKEKEKKSPVPLLHWGAGVQAAGRNSGVTGKECQRRVIKLEQKIRPERFAWKELRMSREMSEIFSLSSHLASGADYVCFKGTGGFRRRSPGGAFKIFPRQGSIIGCLPAFPPAGFCLKIQKKHTHTHTSWATSKMFLGQTTSFTLTMGHLGLASGRNLSRARGGRSVSKSYPSRSKTDIYRPVFFFIFFILILDFPAAENFYCPMSS